MNKDIKIILMCVCVCLSFLDREYDPLGILCYSKHDEKVLMRTEIRLKMYLELIMNTSAIM